MDLNEAIRRSILSYYENNGLKNISEMKDGEVKYTMDYFDKFEDEQFGEEDDMMEDNSETPADPVNQAILSKMMNQAGPEGGMTNAKNEIQE